MTITAMMAYRLNWLEPAIGRDEMLYHFKSKAFWPMELKDPKDEITRSLRATWYMLSSTVRRSDDSTAWKDSCA